MSHTILNRRTALAMAAGLAVRSAAAQPAIAQPVARWPERQVRLVNNGAPGSGIDLVARVLAEGLARRLGLPVVPENRAGAGVLLAAEAHANARPGETLLLGPTGIASTVPYTQEGRLPYDPERDLVPVGVAAAEFLCVAVNAAVPAADVAALVALAKAQPDALNWYSVPGFFELSFRMFLRERGLEMSYVAYRGSTPAVLDLAAGRIQAAVLPLTPALAAIRAGSIRALAVTAGSRAPMLPAVPTLAEAGFPELGYDAFTALFGWRGMPAEVQQRLSAVVAEVMHDPATGTTLAQAGMQARGGSPAELAEVIGRQRARVQAALRVLGGRVPS